MRILVPNLGSTSLKYQLIETDNETVLARGKIDRIGGTESQVITWQSGMTEESRSTAQIPDHRAAIKILVDRLAGVRGRLESRDCRRGIQGCARRPALLRQFPCQRQAAYRHAGFCSRGAGP